MVRCSPGFRALPIPNLHHHVLDWQVMNEIALHRGSSPHLNTIDIFVDGQHLTEAVVRPFYPYAHSRCD